MRDCNPSPAVTGNHRVPLSKKLRFEIFKRDDFTCQYCGAQPPAVVLEVDHIHPVAEGGGSEPENLITSCSKCNRGKGKRTLGDKIVRPDADLMWLRSQQEIAELKRYQKAKAQREQAIVDIVEQLQTHWCDFTGLDWAPSDAMCRRLLNNNSPEVVEKAFNVVGPKVASGKLRYADEWQPYLHAVCRNMTNDVIPESRELVELREQHEQLQQLKKMICAFLAMVLDEYDCIDIDSAFEFHNAGYALVLDDLAHKHQELIWHSLDEGVSWKLWVRGSRDNG